MLLRTFGALVEDNGSDTPPAVSENLTQALGMDTSRNDGDSNKHGRADVPPENSIAQTNDQAMNPAQTPARDRPPARRRTSSCVRVGCRTPSPEPPEAWHAPTRGVDAFKNTLSTLGRDTKTPRPADRATSSLIGHHNMQPTTSSSGPASRPGLVTQRENATPGFIRQPDYRAFTQAQTTAEIKAICASLSMAEAKCIHAINDFAGSKVDDKQYRDLSALHRLLLDEYHDFFTVSQRPCASRTVSELPVELNMQARMWRHGIHSFLELLRPRLPDSREHLLTFLDLANSRLALLYEIVPAFEETWTQCLGDLARYRMAALCEIVPAFEELGHDPEHWNEVSRLWYSKTCDKKPTLGILYHHLAILARPDALRQLFYYAKSLCVPIQFHEGKDSIATFFNSVMVPGHNQFSGPTAFFRCHWMLFSTEHPEKFRASAERFIASLHSLYPGQRFLKLGQYIGITTCCAIASYGDEQGPVFRALKNPPSKASADQPIGSSGYPGGVPGQVIDAIAFANRTHEVFLRRFGDTDILPYVHVNLVFMYRLTFLPSVFNLVAREFPWDLASLLLNKLLDSYQTYFHIESETFPSHRPLPEDYAQRGLIWTERYYPDHFFSNDLIDNEKHVELPSMLEDRKERILYLGCRIAAQGGKHLRYNSETHRFSVPLGLA